MTANNASNNTEIEIQAAVFRRLVDHFRERTDVQNIDVMELTGFCRNCLAKWYVQAAKAQGQDIGYERAREIIYGMPYAQWKDTYQKP
ncbi:MAG: DUF1244 domain-containing protein [Pseudomonadota bacterium]